jgi:transcriptional regulator with XRE-family HTH domain
MSAIDPKTFLWANIEALMGGGKQTVDAVHARTRVSRGTIQRVKEAKTSVGVGVLVEIADAFGIEVWELLRPDLGEQPVEKAKTLSAESPRTSASLIHDLSALLIPLDEADREQAEVLLRRLATRPEEGEQWAKKLSKLLGEMKPSDWTADKRAA